MKQMNLLPNAVKERSARKRLISALIVVALLALGSVGIVYAGVHAQVVSAQNQKEERERLDAQAVEQAAKEQQRFALSPDVTARVEQINTLSKTDISWKRAFSFIGSLIPQDVVLSSFSFGSGENARTLRIGGEAPSNVSFASFVQSLEGAKEVESAKVEGYNYTPGKGTVAFNIVIQVPQEAVGYIQP